jgi:hypothetical protein
VIEFPWIGDVRQVLIWAVKVNVIVVITVKKVPDFESAAQADEMTYGVGIFEGNVSGVIRAQACATNRDAVS